MQKPVRPNSRPLFRSLYLNQPPIMNTDRRTLELIQIRRQRFPRQKEYLY
jgi:hypothetical protein